MSDFFWFSDAQWSRLEPLLPTDVRGRKQVDDRRVLSGIVHALRCGGRWADCADVYGPKKTLYNRFVRWSERGVWERVFSALAGPEDAPDRLFIDSSCIKVHRCAGGGMPSGPGAWYRPHQRRTQHQAPCCLRRQGPPPRPAPDARQCERLHGRAALHPGHAAVSPPRRRQGLRQPGLAGMAHRAGHPTGHPPRKNRKVQYDYDKVLYRQRNVVERMFCRFKDWRRIATRFDRNLATFMGAIALAATVIWWL